MAYTTSILSNFMSNTAAATILVPVGVALAPGFEPLAAVSIALAFLSRRGATRALAAAGALATAIALLFTFSRGGFLAFAGIVLLAISRVRPRWAAAAILIATVAIGYALLPKAYQDRLATVRLDDYSLNLRFGIWREGLAMAAEHPWGIWWSRPSRPSART